MTILGIILHKTTGLKCVSTDVISYETLKSGLSDYTHVVIATYSSERGTSYINLVQLIEAQPMTFEDGSVVSDWTTLSRYIDALGTTIFNDYICNILVPKRMQISANRYIITPFESKNNSQMSIIGLENTMGFNIEFGDHQDPFGKRNSGVSSLSNDLVITTTTDTNLYNAIPIVNGAVFYPSVWKNIDTGIVEMFAYNAGKWTINSNWVTNDTKTVPHYYTGGLDGITQTRYSGGDAPVEHATSYNKGLILLDLSSVGEIDMIKLCDCVEGTVSSPTVATTSIDVINADEGNRVMTTAERTTHKAKVQSTANTFWRKGVIDHYDVSYYTITFKLPADTKIGTPVVCLFGRLFFINHGVVMQNIGDGYQITVTIQKYLLDNIMMSNLQWYSEVAQSDYFIQNITSTTLEHLFDDPDKVTYANDLDQDLSSRLHVPFVMMIHSDEQLVMSYIEPIMSLSNGNIIFPKYSGGLLMNRITREIVDYTKIWYENSTLVQMNQSRPLLTINKDIHKLTDPSLIYNKDNNIGFNEYTTYRDMNEYLLLDIGHVEATDET